MAKIKTKKSLFLKYVFLLLISVTLYSGHLNVAYGSIAMDQFSKKDTMISMNMWIDEILIDTNYTATFKIYDKSSEMAKDFNLGKIDLALNKPLEFVKYFDKSKMKYGFSGGMEDRNDDNFVLVMRHNESLKDLYSIKNPIVALRINENLPKIVVKYLFLKNTQNDNINFIETKKHSSALLKLFFKQVDAAVVSKKTFDFANELNPQISKKLKIVYHSKVSSGTFGYFREGFSNDLHKIITNLALKIVNSNRGEQLLMIFKTDRVIKTYVKDLKPVENLYKNYIKLKKGKNEKKSI